jgi:hypothetical protein
MRKSKISMRTLMLSGLIFAAGMAGAVQAATLESGIVYGGPSQTHVACEVVNMSSAPIHFVKIEVIGQYNGSLKPFYDDCGMSLGQGGVCSFQAPAVREAAACKVIIQEAKTDVHGTMVALSDPVGDPSPLSESDLR